MSKAGKESCQLLLPAPAPIFEKFLLVLKGPRRMLKFKTPSTCKRCVGGGSVKIAPSSASGVSKYFLMNRITQEFDTLENIHSLAYETGFDDFVRV